MAKFGLVDILCYMSIYSERMVHTFKEKNAYWLNLLWEKKKIFTASKTKAKNKSNITGLVYGLLIEGVKIDNNKIKIQWELDTGKEMYDSIWDNLIHDVFSLTNCTKLRYFQYRLINRTLTTNIQRNRWDNNISPLCSFCKSKEESYVHLLYSCDKVLPIWKSLKKMVRLFLFC